jgi:hypothetical protein
MIQNNCQHKANERMATWTLVTLLVIVVVLIVVSAAQLMYDASLDI